MNQLVWRTGFAVLVLGAVASTVAVLGFLAARPVEARDDDRTRLLVVCEQDDVTDVLAALVPTRAQVWDLRTMKRLSRPADAPVAPIEPAAAPPPARGPVPPLRDARRVMDEVLAAAAGSEPAATAAPPLLTELVVQERRASLKLLVAAPADVGAVARALRANPWLAPRLEAVETGALQKTPDGRLRATLSLRFDPDFQEPRKAVALTELPVTAIRQATLAAKLEFVYASPVMADANRKRGFATVSREYTFRPATLPQLRTLLANLGAGAPGLTVFELRWKRDPKSGGLTKPVIRVGGRSTLAR